MSDGVLAGLTLSTVAIGLWLLRYGGSSPATWFLLSWVLSTFGVFLYVIDGFPLLASTYYVHATIATALLVGGVVRLLDRPVWGWFIPAMLGFGLARVAIAGAGFAPLAGWLGLPVGLMTGAVGVVAIRNRPRAGRTLGFRLLGPVLLVVCGIGIATLVHRVVYGEAPTQLLAAWLVLGPVLLAVQLYAVAEHRTNESERRQAKLERLVAERASEIARVNESLAESEKRYRAVSELSSDFSFCLRIDDDAGEPIREWVTEAFERITGYPPSILDDDGWAILLHGEARSASADDLRYLASLEDEAHLAYALRRPDGERRWLEVVLRADRSSPDGALRILGAARDVTGAHLADQGRRELERQVEAAERLESLGMLTGGIAHDFNNLLVVILGNARLLRDELPEGSPQAQRVAQIRQAADQAARLTEQMLAYSGEAIVRLAPLELGGLLRELGSVLADGRSAGELRIEPDGDVVVRADATRLTQAILNVVTNAWESQDSERPVVTVRSGVCELDRAALARTSGATGAEPGLYGFVEVVDEGPGMPAETLRRVFEPFYTTKFSGRGLGLAAALGIVRAHRGRVSVESAPGRGTRVRLLLPAANTDVSEDVAPGAPAPVAGRVLVVDDDEAVLELASEFLKRAGFEASRAAGGNEAIDLFAQKSADVDVVVLDLTMPDMDGHDVFRELRRVRPDIPIVLATGYSRGTLEDAFAGETGVAFLRKPYEPEQLTAAIQSALERASVPA